MTMTAWRDTFKDRVNQTEWKDKWRTLLYGRISANYALHVRVKHGVSTRVFRTDKYGVKWSRIKHAYIEITRVNVMK